MDDQKGDISKTAKRMVRTYQDIIGEQCRKHDNVFAVSDEDKKIAYIQKERQRDRENVSKKD